MVVVNNYISIFATKNGGGAKIQTPPPAYNGLTNQHHAFAQFSSNSGSENYTHIQCGHKNMDTYYLF